MTLSVRLGIATAMKPTGGPDWFALCSTIGSGTPTRADD